LRPIRPKPLMPTLTAMRKFSFVRFKKREIVK